MPLPTFRNLDRSQKSGCQAKGLATIGYPAPGWVWAAMNPISYSATQALDNALVGRFAIFLYPPDVHEMDEPFRNAELALGDPRKDPRDSET